MPDWRKRTASSVFPEQESIANTTAWLAGVFNSGGFVIE
jgi:hypothetical protein